MRTVRGKPMTLTKTFDRVDDISKIEGCNTRGIEYRWPTFSKVMATFPAGSNALDFGAGSLRESFDLAMRGFNVTSIDIDSELMSAYKSGYDWPANGTSHRLVAASDLTDGLSKIGGQRFALVTCFDVLEHLGVGIPIRPVYLHLVLQQGAGLGDDSAQRARHRSSLVAPT